MPETIDPPIKEPPVPPTPTRPTTPEPEPPDPESDDNQASSLTFKQRFNAVAQSLRGRGTNAEIEQLRAELSSLETARNTAQADLKVAQAALVMAQAERDRAMGLAEAADRARTDFDAKVEAKSITKSIDIVAAAHVPVAELPVSGIQGESAPQTKEQVEAALEGKSFQEKRAILQAWNNRSRK
jgi:hypothetical protein